MIVTLEQIQAGIIKYIDHEVAVKATGFTKFMVYFVTPSIPNIVNNYLNTMKSNDLFSEFFDENGNVNIDVVQKRAKEAMSKSGKVLIQKFNYFIDASDIDLIANYIKNS